MKAVVQRVKEANVKVGGEIVGQIEKGLLVLLAIHKDDAEEKITKMAEKIINLRVFSDKNDKMNLSLLDISGQILVVSQFTLYADTKKGNRPSFMESAKPDKAKPFYEKFIKYMKNKGIKTQAGEFGAMMDVSLTNSGPVTIILDI